MIVVDGQSYTASDGAITGLLTAEDVPTTTQQPTTKKIEPDDDNKKTVIIVVVVVVVVVLLIIVATGCYVSTCMYPISVSNIVTLASRWHKVMLL